MPALFGKRLLKQSQPDFFSACKWWVLFEPGACQKGPVLLYLCSSHLCVAPSFYWETVVPAAVGTETTAVFSGERTKLPFMVQCSTFRLEERNRFSPLLQSHQGFMFVLRGCVDLALTMQGDLPPLNRVLWCASLVFAILN